MAICLRAGEVLAGQAVRVGGDLGIGPGGDHLAAAHAGAGAEIDDVVGRPHRVLVVLHHDDGVAHVAQPFEAAQQPVVVARVQADARLIEDVEDADQAAADLARQADALGLAAGKGRGGAVEREIMQADVEQEADAGRAFPSAPPGDGALDRASASFPGAPAPAPASGQIADRHGADFDQRLAADADGPRLGVEPLALAGGAAHHAHVLFQLHPPRPGRRLLEAAQELRDDALPTCRRASRRRRRAASTRR